MWRIPAFGQIAWCCFPYNGHITAQRHRCLILHVMQSQSGLPWVIVAGGTSANKNGKWLRAIEPIDFLLQGDEIKSAGLQNPTIFRFEAPGFNPAGQFVGGTLLGLPWSKQYFVTVAPNADPVIGCIDLQRASIRDKFRQAARVANLASIIETEYQRCRQSID